MQQKKNFVIINSLLEDFEEQREALKVMIQDIEGIKKDIGNLFPDKLDARHKFLFEERVKTAVSLLNVLLDVRKELIKTVKDEIDLRRKITDAKEDDLDNLFNIRDLAKKIDKLNRKKEQVLEKIEIIDPKKVVIPESIKDDRPLELPKPEEEVIKESLDNLKVERGIVV